MKFCCRKAVDGDLESVGRDLLAERGLAVEIEPSGDEIFHGIEGQSLFTLDRHHQSTLWGDLIGRDVCVERDTMSGRYFGLVERVKRQADGVETKDRLIIGLTSHF